MAKLSINELSDILFEIEDEKKPLKEIRRSPINKQNKIDNPVKDKIKKYRIPYSEYILNKIKRYENLIELVKSNHVFIVSAVYNSGMKELKSYNNRCEFKLKVNRGDSATVKALLLSKKQVEELLALLNQYKQSKQSKEDK